MWSAPVDDEEDDLDRIGLGTMSVLRAGEEGTDPSEAIQKPGFDEEVKYRLAALTGDRSQCNSVLDEVSSVRTCGFRTWERATDQPTSRGMSQGRS